MHVHTQPQSSRLASPSSCDCQKETAILWKAQCKFILYSLERLLHFTVHLSLRLEQRLCALWRRQTQSIKALFLEASSLTVETSVWWNNTCDLRCTEATTWSGDAAKIRFSGSFCFYHKKAFLIPTCMEFKLDTEVAFFKFLTSEGMKIWFLFYVPRFWVICLFVVRGVEFHAWC